MRDIYHVLVVNRQDLQGYSEPELEQYRNICDDAEIAINCALRAIGNLAAEVCHSENYSDEDAKDDLNLIGAVLRHLPRMAQALKQNSDCSTFLLSERKAGVDK